MKKLVFSLLALMLPLALLAQGPIISVKTTPGKIRFTTVEKNSLYEKAGFRSGDVVKEINGKAADENSRIYDIDEVINKGGSVKVERKGKLKLLKIKAMQEPASEPLEENISN